MNGQRLYLIDATAFCYRAFYALKGLSTSFGQPTNAIYGFINMLNKILKRENPDYLAVCLDVSRDTFRTKKFAQYKINRPPMPDGLSSQIPLIKEIVSALGIAIFEKEGYEADDIIATLAKKAKGKGLSTTIVSSDKDILQLVDKETLVFSPYKDEGAIYDDRKVFQRFSIKPQRIVDIIALMGDDVDNIPGIPGIGEKTAVELITTFGSLEKLLNNIDQISKPKIKKAVSDNVDNINLNRELAVLKQDVEIDFDLDKLKIGQPNYRELTRLFKYLEFKTFLNELPLQEGETIDIRVSTLKEDRLKELLRADDELVLYGETLGDMKFFAKDEYFQIENTGDITRAVLRDPRIKKISHDLKKIKISLAREDIVLEGLHFDTMLAAYLLNPSKPAYGLADISWDYLNKAMPKDAAIHRALDLITQLKPRLEKELHDKALFSLFNDLEMPLAEVLAEMELKGIKLDPEVLSELSCDIEKRLIRLIEDIYALSGCQFNINSPKQLREVLFEKLKLPIVKKSKTGPSTDEEVLRNLASRHKLPALLLEYRQLAKLKNTYVDTLPHLIDKRTGRIHTSFNQTATETGRLSSSNPNLQNIPVKTDIGKNLRRAIVASGSEFYLLSCDYSQIELRVLAHLSKDENLTLAFKEDRDIHRATAVLIFGVEEKDITEAMREVAKRANFGIIYGLTSYGLSRDLGISVEDAQRFIDAYFAKYPRVKDYIQQQIEKAEDRGFVTTLLGRRRYLPEINNKNLGIRQFAQRQAVNTPIQGSAADLIKLAMVQIQREIKKRRLESRMVLQIHDELLFDVRHNELGEASGLVKDRMENVLELSVPIKVDIKKGRNWLEMEAMK